MAHAAIYLPDEKKPLDGENEKLLDLEDNPALPKYDDVVAEPKRSPRQRLKNYLPSVKDIVNLLLFSAVAVIGMTFISEAFFKAPGNTVRLCTLHVISRLLKRAIEAYIQS